MHVRRSEMDIKTQIMTQEYQAGRQSRLFSAIAEGERKNSCKYISRSAL